MQSKTFVLGVPIDNVTRAKAKNKLIEFLSDEKYGKIVVTPNPEVIVMSQKDELLKKIITKADLVVPDGIGVVIASKINKVKLVERVAGCDLVLSLFEHIKNTNHTVYLLGAAPGIAKIAQDKLTKTYVGLKIIGTSDGYFDANRESEILEEIRTLKPDIVLVGLGVPRQEKWIYANKNLPIKLFIGVGGSIDVFAGTVKRAPETFQKLGLEWFYRLLKQPSRFFRMLTLPKFVFLCIVDKFKKAE